MPRVEVKREERRITRNSASEENERANDFSLETFFSSPRHPTLGTKIAAIFTASEQRFDFIMVV